MDPEDEIPCQFQIPLTYGDDGREIEPEKLLLFHKVLRRQFGGFTPLGEIRGGAWHDETENQLRLEVWVRRWQIPILKQIISSIGHSTKQQQMFVIIPDARVERINVPKVPAQTPWLFDEMG
jgi:hypothetical protein